MLPAEMKQDQSVLEYLLLERRNSTLPSRDRSQVLGSALLDRLVADAGAAGIRRLRCEVLVENSGMRNLARHLGGDPRWLGDGIVEYDCELPQRHGEPAWGLAALAWTLRAWCRPTRAPGPQAWTTA